MAFRRELVDDVGGTSSMAAARRTKAVELFWRIHPHLYRWSGGRLGGKLLGLPVLLLDTIGRKSGRARTNALTYLPDGSAYVVIASFVGEPRHPAWLLNLRAAAEAQIQVGSRRIAVRAREAVGAERERLWSEVVARLPDYAEYQSRTERKIPVVVLEPQASS
jgi:deazaflavin-dependent oxidoreductase (nitroreductase family)